MDRDTSYGNRPQVRHLKSVLAILLGSFLGTQGMPGVTLPGKPYQPASRGAAAASPQPVRAAQRHLPQAERGLPVFCYHHIQPKPNNYISITPGLLEQHLQVLQERGYTTLAATEVPDWLRNPANRNKPAVCLTFDDGNITVLTQAIPLLRRYRMKATLFIYPQAIGTRGKMTWKQLAEVRDLGFDIQCHSMTHDSMLRHGGESDRAFRTRMAREMVASRDRLERLTGKPIKAFAFPFGWHAGEHVDLLREHGYSIAYTVNEGVNDSSTDPLLLRRQSVFRKDDLAAFIRKLETRPLAVRGIQPADTTTVAQYPVTIQAVTDTPCTDMTIDFKPAVVESDNRGRCSSGPYYLKPGFHTVTVNVRDGGEGPRTASWGFLAQGDPATWRFRGRFWKRVNAAGQVLPDPVTPTPSALTGEPGPGGLRRVVLRHDRQPKRP